jgi:hypothetical protein
VVQPDGGDQRDVRVDDVDRVEPTAEPDLKDQRIEGVLREQPECGERAELEIGQPDVAARAVDRVERRAQGVVGDRLAVDADTLVVTLQVGRRIAAEQPTR